MNGLTEREPNFRRQAGKTIDTSNRRDAMKKKQEAEKAKAAAAKAKADALKKKNAEAAKAAAAKKAEMAKKAEAKRREMAKKTAALNKTVGGTSRFAKSKTPAPKMKDPLAGKEYKGLFGGLFGKKK